MLTGINVPIRIGGVTVMPGDLVVGDREGVYFIPPQLVKEVLDHADETHIHDEWTKKKFDEGKYKSCRDLWLAEGSEAAAGVPRVSKETARRNSQAAELAIDRASTLDGVRQRDCRRSVRWLGSDISATAFLNPARHPRITARLL